MKVVFILSAGHSGSTLLDILLNAHPHVFGGGEIHTLKQNGTSQCACGVTAAACPVWSHVLSDLSFLEQGLEVYRPKSSFLLNARDYRYVKAPNTSVDRGRFVEANEEIYQRLREVTGSSIIVDSSKSPDRVRAIAESNSIEPYVIHLVRDGRAVTWSYLKKYGRGWCYFTWLFQNVKIEQLRHQCNMPWLRIHYDELVAHPDSTLKRITQFITADATCELTQANSLDRHQIGGNRMKFSFDGIKPDTAWQHEMSRRQRWLSNAITAPLNTHYVRMLFSNR